MKKILLAEGAQKIEVKEQTYEVTVLLEEAFLKCSKGRPTVEEIIFGYIDVV